MLCIKIGKKGEMEKYDNSSAIVALTNYNLQHKCIVRLLIWFYMYNPMYDTVFILRV